MKGFKIRVNSPEHSRKIQEHLLSLGYSWFQGKKVLYTEQPFLIVDQDNKEIGYIFHEFFENSPHTEIELIEKISYEFKEVSKRNVVKVGEFSYYEDELAEALENIKPI